MSGIIFKSEQKFFLGCCVHSLRLDDSLFRRLKMTIYNFFSPFSASETPLYVGGTAGLRLLQEISPQVSKIKYQRTTEFRALH